VVPRNVRLGEAPSFGKSIIGYDAHSAGAMSYLELAREILQNGHRPKSGPAAVTLAAPKEPATT
jgi:chromosome partitioning protein